MTTNVGLPALSSALDLWTPVRTGCGGIQPVLDSTRRQKGLGIGFPHRLRFCTFGLVQKQNHRHTQPHARPPFRSSNNGTEIGETLFAFKGERSSISC